ncbi:3-deoxy-manno-octulosonate cytidylyltransferase [Marinimicrobium sp. ABcell2]|uniref:3-deoxy-manno-octulosonate cytidylyltransferase n=1 Tax=Marinimicrobium sp. ABcell2 TaxID=3069751 RepID=UPI0027B06AD6|nr:3-deoxy-manno-octulosonate cytidylyltransferase [Marinimicrobium sp. ABcell2]MDQ2075609.1 3-deoxy-manno-octulosonate cytidylyltransferase [Marinimicrobium sp. ABcell2]
MSFYVVIPARYASTRLPGKPLREIGGKPMVQHVYERALQSGAEKVIIATDDPRIEAAAHAFGAPVCMTSANHQSGTDRLQEVAQKMGLEPDAIVVNVQGDEPLIPPSVIDQVATNLAAHTDASVATLYEPINRLEDFRNPNVVKAVLDHNGMALYFSRAPVPWPRDLFASEDVTSLPTDFPARRHIGIYAYRASLLDRFVTWPQAPLEQIEALEQLRVLAQGERIHLAAACAEVPGGVDTEADLQRVRYLIEDGE